MQRILLFLAAMLLSAGALAMDPSSVDMKLISEVIIERGDKVVDEYSPETGVLTGQALSRLYFDVFEGGGMEFALGIYDQSAMLNLEMQFSRVMSLAMQGGDKADLKIQWRVLGEQLTVAASTHQGKHTSGFWSLFIQSFLILLREGFEAMLVVTALVTYLRRSGAGDRVNVVWAGVGMALLASVAMAWVLNHYTQQLTGAAREALEGMVMLFAAVVLIYVSYWLFAKREAERWQAFIHQQIDRAVGSGSLIMLGLAAFLAVFREGAETILFYQALMVGGEVNASPVAAGFALACVALVGVFYLLRYSATRLPLRTFFTVTAVFLFLMAFIFVGKGVLELQVAGWIAMTPVSAFFQFPLLGIFPSMQSLGAQVALLLFAGLPYAYKILMRKQYSVSDAAKPHTNK